MARRLRVKTGVSLAVLGVVATVAPATGQAKRRPARTPPSNAVIFEDASSDAVDARIEIAYVSAGGGTVVTLTHASRHGMVAAEPAWSPDGSRIAFVMGPRGQLTAYAGDGDIYVMDANGTHIRRLTQGFDASGPVWSPDRSQIAFIEGQGQALAVMRADGSHQYVIAHRRGYYESPAWSPDGRLIAYDSGPDWSTHAIFTIRPNGRGERRLTPLSATTGGATWSPNGSRIAYSSGNRLWIMDSDGTSPHPLTTCRLPCVDDSQPAWSPSGVELVFVRDETGGGGATRLYVLQLSTGGVRPLTPRIRWAQHPGWRP